MADAPNPMSKIRSASLREWAEARPAERITVVLEVGPPPRSWPTPRREAGEAVPGAFEFSGAEDAALLRGVKRRIERAGGSVVTMLEWSGTLVVEIAAGRLADIARLDAVAAIWPHERGEA